MATSVACRNPGDLLPLIRTDTPIADPRIIRDSYLALDARCGLAGFSATLAVPGGSS